MRRFIATFSLFFIFTVSACGETAPQPKGPAMWRLQTEAATVYFLGSIHMLSEEVEWRDNRVDQAMDEAGTVVFEIDQREAEDPGMAQKMLSMAMLPADETLESLLSPDVFEQLDDAARDVGVSAATFNHMKPWFAAMNLVVLDMVSRGHMPDGGVDMVLHKEVLARGGKIAALETLEEQLAVLDSLSTEEPDVLIHETVRFLGEDNSYMDDLVEAWRQGDTGKLEALLIEEMAQYEDAYENFVTNRNRNWIPQITDMVKQGGTYFVVVGAAHLVGDDSVIKMLETDGYAVTRF